MNENVDYRINIDPSNYPLSPFTDVYIAGAAAGPTNTGISELKGAYGRTGTVLFRLRRDIIGGGFMIPGGIVLGNLYRYVKSNRQPPVPIIRLITTMTIVPLPVVCSINDGKLITVAFGNMDTSLVTTRAATTPYTKPMALNYSCNTSLAQDIKINLIADSADFSADAIKTSNTDIGVVMQHQGVTVPPMGYFASKVVNGVGSDNVTFSAIKRPGEIELTGPFNSSAILLITSL